MAKAKKTEKAHKDDKPSKAKPAATTKKSAAAAPAAAKGKAPAAKKSAASGPPSTPMIDTNLAASAAAAMILNRAVTGGAAPVASGQPPAAKKESATFKNLKDSLNKPAGSALGGILSSGDQQKKSNLPFGGGKQVGRNQTFGADVNRAGVPRRTGGG